MPYVCLLQNGVSSIPKHIEKATHNHYSAVAIAINNNIKPYEPNLSSCTYPDMVVESDTWNKKVLLMISDNIDCDSLNPKFREHSQEMLMRDKLWAEHLQSAGVMMVRLRKRNNVCLRSLITYKIKSCLTVRVPISNPAVAAFEHDKKEDDDMQVEQNEDTWEWWNDFHAGCNFNSKVKVILELDGNERPNKEVVRRWLGEPIEAIIVHSSLFIRNRHNYAVLPKDWQTIIGLFISAHANIIIYANATDNSLMQYADYMQKMINDCADTHSMASYEDVLEIPLQPLMDNLDSYTYEIFEMDPVKYKLYQLAIEQALLDRVSEEEVETKTSIVMVLGAGRGPLVRSVFNAAHVTQRKVRVYIIEKNPNAIRTISNMVKGLWSNKDVHIFSDDMRNVQPPELADILVSELLGSFSDNELSPECLDGALKLLKPDGISIPCKSTSYINPIMSSKLYNNLRDFERSDKAAYDYGYVTLLKNVFHIDEPKALFEFHHPNRDAVIDNERYKVLHFQASNNCMIHGIGGYFDAVLYKDITMSINPLTHTPGMFSWFPMFFPLKPFKLKKGQEIEIHFWRKVNSSSVWYQWSLEKPTVTQIYNHGGVGYNIRY